MTDHHQTGPQLHAPPDASAHPLLIPSLSHSVPFNDCESETCLRACHAPGAAPPRAAANRNGLATEAGDRLMLMPPPACLPAWLAASYCTRLAGVAPSKHGRRRSRAASRAARQRSPPLRERAAHGVRMHLLRQLGGAGHPATGAPDLPSFVDALLLSGAAAVPVPAPPLPLNLAGSPHSVVRERPHDVNRPVRMPPDARP